MRSPLAFEHRIKALFELVKMKHVRSGIGLLLLGQGRRGPVRTLLLLGQLDAGEFCTKILEAVAIGIGPRQLGCDLGAVDRRRVDAEIVLHNRDIEAREVKDLQDPRVRQQRLEIGCVLTSLRKLHEVRSAITGRELHDT